MIEIPKARLKGSDFLLLKGHSVDISASAKFSRKHQRCGHRRQYPCSCSSHSSMDAGISCARGSAVVSPMQSGATI